MKHLWNVEKGSSGERVVTSSEGHSLFEGPLQGTSLRNQLLSPSSPSFDLVLGSHWLNPNQSPRDHVLVVYPGYLREREDLEGQIHMLFKKDFYPNTLILKYCLCQLYHFLRPFYLNSIDASICSHQ